MSQNHDEIQQEIRDMKKLLYGDPTTGKGGMAQGLITVADAVFGTERNPGGLVADNAQQKKVMWIMFGALTAANFFLQILFHFWKP